MFRDLKKVGKTLVQDSRRRPSL